MKRYGELTGASLRVWGGKSSAVGTGNGCQQGQEDGKIGHSHFLTSSFLNYSLALRNWDSVPALSLKLMSANPMEFSWTFILLHTLQKVTVVASPIFHDVFFSLHLQGSERSWSSCCLLACYFSSSSLSPPTLRPPTHLPTGILGGLASLPLTLSDLIQYYVFGSLLYADDYQIMLYKPSIFAKS